MDESIVFLQQLKDEKMTACDRAVAALWYHGRTDTSVSRTTAELADELEAAGYARPNPTRLRESLSRDKRTAKAGTNGFRIRIQARRELDDALAPFATYTPLPNSDSVLPLDLFLGTRTYIEKVVRQINASFDAGLYDCSAVMCRRLLETLIIETFERAGKAKELEGPDGNYVMLSGLVSILKANESFKLGRNSEKALEDFKRLGDLSAHNRRFNARRDDLVRIRDGLRVATEELLTLAGLNGG